ncbi:anaphase-promoting complex subunit 11, variant 1 [Blastomyces dermatitidis ER-3]|uniref:Anaphase-promoting complex subunit 11 n=2 Tax=Ajellomyces dermatitidis TaxID=5039 RepID=F2TTM8_AJEDA|nr:anaphase-promoting complex subunit 11 [Blastomyces dermatitidis ER-3]XP_045282152.1 anaphase-promoting complex subunit 11, variant 1 [Blastomyces dermatitidis ER-3]EGE86591.2 anaphase-promoting complex subunit 11 [Blastomyces dermatitidis ATCC 18188]EQL28573.1 anaphase-promoting complex subunit 11 [Blastomyces dermatitidis ATCC 26199]EQL28574.1 anaphase-promoting complex subunit 11, variant 1 [Blastomyces dermatitidis ATCC 26199]KMW69120.1 anaphase-promoting complex subunit 11, variant 1 [B
MKVTLREWNAVATWRWDMPEDEVCGICRVHFDGTCPTCKFPGDDCSLLIGKCGHSFHMHCLLTWIGQESSKGLCPMCRQSMSPGEAPPQLSVNLTGNKVMNDTVMFLIRAFGTSEYY